MHAPISFRPLTVMYKLFGNRSFAQEIDLSGVHVDVALRKFQTYFRMPVGVIKTDTRLYFSSPLYRYSYLYQPVSGGWYVPVLGYVCMSLYSQFL